MYKRLVFLLVLWLIGCSPASDYNKEFDLTKDIILLQVLEFATSDALVLELQTRGINVDLTSSKPDVTLSLTGQAIVTKADGVTTCTLFIVTPKVRKVDDDFTLTLGHELEHCLYGRYHR